MTRRTRLPASLCAFVLAFGASAASAQVRAAPDPVATPGALDPVVTQWTIGETICRPGWTRSVRPPQRYTGHLKRAQMAAAGLADADPRGFEEDHLVPLELGGARYEPRNLWPEPRFGVWNAALKDRLAAVLHRLVCRGALPLNEARRAFLAPADWRQSFCRYVEGPPCGAAR